MAKYNIFDAELEIILHFVEVKSNTCSGDISQPVKSTIYGGRELNFVNFRLSFLTENGILVMIGGGKA